MASNKEREAFSEPERKLEPPVDTMYRSTDSNQPTAPPPPTGNANDIEAAPPYDPSKPQEYDSELPTYQQALHDPTVPPPTYDSLYGKIKDVKKKSTGIADFLMKILETLVSTMCFTILLGIVIAIPVSMIAIGSIHISNCPAERYIPIYLIVAGCFGLWRNLTSFIPRFCKDDKEAKGEEEGEKKSKSGRYLHLIDCFLLAWFIAGNVWIYQIYGHIDYTDPTSNDYCHHTVYTFAFWITTSVYIVIGSMCFCICCGSCVAFFLG
ncbi:transmembrane protein 272 [Patella vulgata]|uniref:transmembrane protein 272 n=1 Tax=Patella vulgata TaxID=6465 RepID=UPI0024A9C747|nr:transmembrane protein 272 [Patella vulgata]